MCQLLETIKVRYNVLQHLSYHTMRISQSRQVLYGKADPWDLSSIIKLPDLDASIAYRCRFLYDLEPGKTEFIPYERRQIRKLYVVDGGTLDYSFKYADRRNFESLRKLVPDSDISDILILKNGFITDTSFANIVLSDGKNWYTPSTPLLKGTKRQYYLDSGRIQEKEIKLSDLPAFKYARIINAMIDLEEGEDIPVKNIII